MPTPKTKRLIASRHGGFNFGHFMTGVAKGVGSAAKVAAPIVLPIAVKGLMGAGPKKRPLGRPRKKKGGLVRRNPRMIGYY